MISQSTCLIQDPMSLLPLYPLVISPWAAFGRAPRPQGCMIFVHARLAWVMWERACSHWSIRTRWAFSFSPASGDWSKETVSGMQETLP